MLNKESFLMAIGTSLSTIGKSVDTLDYKLSTADFDLNSIETMLFVSQLEGSSGVAINFEKIPAINDIQFEDLWNATLS
ncbi:hypothetical protein MAH1_01700 [Sessilibacter sp. MAH1]